ncbi:carboxyl-terminal PDZ ligand of neuronal nitric oxide synthase protein-like, partial [Bombina bombina]|uniref:carboxyl-terminal PDZ ligand of neuronal nitric oxide synthase protein-like n=1 Tax=Bombina bombina TaxID=8345 RepID=UPI00235B047E
IHLLKEQLSAEAAARKESQARVYQLLMQNKELLQHIARLVRQVQDLEIRLSGHNATGSQDSLLKMIFRSTGLPSLYDSCTLQPEDGVLLNIPDSSYRLGSPLGRKDCLVKIQCYRFLPSQGQEAGELLGSLELYRFQESGIVSEYESNTNESEERDSVFQEDGGRLAHVLHRDMLGDSLEDEIAV